MLGDDPMRRARLAAEPLDLEALDRVTGGEIGALRVIFPTPSEEAVKRLEELKKKDAALKKWRGQ